MSAVALCGGLVGSVWTEWSAARIEGSCAEAFALVEVVRWAISAVALCAGMVAFGLKERFAVRFGSNGDERLVAMEEVGLVNQICGLGMPGSFGMG